MYENIREIRNTLQNFFSQEVDEIARGKGFVQRHSKLTGLKFVEIWVMGFLEKPTASLNYLVQVAADLGVKITKQGLQDRLATGAIEMMAALLQRCTTHLQNKVPLALSQ